ncbi:glutathione transferase GstA [Sphingobium sufflavum]|uniref:glutathione transferase GstA n=1 Tax=Sphingobium sufflavum TaxID=1129547 RepID=UPI001F27C517|nr:glutathione transferase GstA [Sphingobium sufflavum]MCE7798149.1 glutathione transferase GstA [Sphingobium sufflavum]
MKLYYSPGACSLADHIALIESGLPFTTVKVDLKAKTTASGEDYRQINPKGYVPALRLDDGEVLTENIAILSFIADKAEKLEPSGGFAHWRVLETTAFVSTELHKNFKPFFSPDSTDEAKAQAGNILGKRFALLEERLGDRSFIVGDTLTIADCYLFVMLMWAKTKVGLTLPSRLDTYFERLKQSPSFAQALSDEGLAN